MRTDLTAGTIVEVTDRGSGSFSWACTVEQPADSPAPNDVDTFVWVRYGNGCVVPVREYYVRSMTAEQVVGELDKLPFSRA